MTTSDLITITQTRDLAPENASAASSALAAYANEVLGALPGDRAKFAKGDWIINDEPVDANEKFIACPETITRCWERWENKRITDRHVARLGERLAPRSGLGDHDRTLWELGLNGRGRDPWSEVHYLGLTRADDGSPVAFGTASDGGQKAIARLASAAAQHPGKAPIVMLAADSYSHKTFGKVLVPQFDIVGWTTAGTTTGKARDGNEPPPPAHAPDGPADYDDLEITPF
jgi:hypothetical protein